LFQIKIQSPELQVLLTLEGLYLIPDTLFESKIFNLSLPFHGNNLIMLSEEILKTEVHTSGRWGLSLIFTINSNHVCHTWRDLQPLILCSLQLPSCVTSLLYKHIHKPTLFFTFSSFLLAAANVWINVEYSSKTSLTTIFSLPHQLKDIFNGKSPSFFQTYFTTTSLSSSPEDSTRRTSNTARNEIYCYTYLKLLSSLLCLRAGSFPCFSTLVFHFTPTSKPPLFRSSKNTEQKKVPNIKKQDEK